MLQVSAPPLPSLAAATAATTPLSQPLLLYLLLHCTSPSSELNTPSSLQCSTIQPRLFLVPVQPLKLHLLHVHQPLPCGHVDTHTHCSHSSSPCMHPAPPPLCCMHPHLPIATPPLPPVALHVHRPAPPTIFDTIQYTI